MQKRFSRKIEEMRRLIDDSRSASVSVGGSGNHWGRKRATPLAAGVESGKQTAQWAFAASSHEVGGVLSAPVVSTSAPRYLLAVSGGMDSMCMADLFLQTLGADSFAIAHCNFSLRGEESDGDETLVREWAERNDIQLFVKRFDTVSYAHENGISIEMAARDLRYGWFADLCKEHGFAVLSVAHNANDNAETLLLNLLRGTGLKGLHGMAEVSSLYVDGGRADRWSELAFSHPRVGGGGHEVGGGQWRPLSARTYDENVILYRPLLEFTRKQIEGYVLTHRVPYRHDSSNFTSDYKRNRIRNEVFPIFEKINPSFIRTLNREIGYFSEAEEIVSDWCAARLPEVLVCNDNAQTSDGLTADGHFLSEARTPVFCPSDCVLRHSERDRESVTVRTTALLATPYWRYLLYHILVPYGFSSQVLASIEDLLTSDRTVSGKRFESPTHILLTGRTTLTVLPLGKSCSAEPEDSRSAVSERSISLCSCSAGHGGTAVPQGDNGNDVLLGKEGSHCLSDDIAVVRGAGTYNFNGSRFTVEVIPWTAGMPLKQPAGVLVMDADKMKFPFVCRRWRQGDWLIPLGMRGKKKVSDLFTDLKYDTLAKDAAIMIVDTRTEGLAQQQHVAGLLGVRIDDRYKITPSATRKVVRISMCDL